MKLFQRNDIWWVRMSGRRKYSTGCHDEMAARLIAIQVERAQAILDILEQDTSGTVARILHDHLMGKGYVLKDVRPVGARGRVYFVECPAKGLIKIGFTTDVVARLRTMQTSATDDLRLIGSFEGTRKTEQSLHIQFLSRRKTREWFSDCPELRECIAIHLGGQQVASERLEVAKNA